MADKVGDEFTGFVTGVTAFGLHIDSSSTSWKARVHVSTMADDYYRFIEKAHPARREIGRVYRLGDKSGGAIDSRGPRTPSRRSGLTEILDAVRDSERNGPRRSRASPKQAGRRKQTRRSGRRAVTSWPRERAFEASSNANPNANKKR